MPRWPGAAVYLGNLSHVLGSALLIATLVIRTRSGTRLWQGNLVASRLIWGCRISRIPSMKKSGCDHALPKPGFQVGFLLASAQTLSINWVNRRGEGHDYERADPPRLARETRADHAGHRNRQ